MTHSASLRIALHADDMGMNRAVSQGIVRGFRHGLLTSTSVLANAPNAADSLQLWKAMLADQAAGRLPSAEMRRSLDDPACPFDLGIHLNLTQGRPLSGNRFPSELLDAEGRFTGIFALFARLKRSGGRFHAAIQAELEQQIQLVCDHGLRPSHLNGHQYIEMIPAVSDVLPELMARFGIKTIRVAWEPSLLRSTVLCGQFWKWPLAYVKRTFAGHFRTRMDVLGITHPDAFFGTTHAGGVNLRLLRLFLASARRYRFIEIGLHPGEASSTSAADNADGWNDPLADLRPNELRMLVSAELPKHLQSAGWRLGRLSGLTAIVDPKIDVY